MEKLYEAWRDYDVEFYYLYTREPHPGFYEKPQTMALEERKANARQCEKDLGMTLPWIIDDMKSSVQNAYGGLPNCSYIISIEGKVYYKEAWANAAKINEKLKEMYESNPEYKAKASEYLKVVILSQKDASERSRLGVKLSKLACKEALKDLAEILGKETDTDAKTKLVEAFSFTKQKECIEILINMLGDPEEIVRAAVNNTLEKLTGMKFGFDPSAGEKERNDALKKAGQWWDLNKDKLNWSENLQRFETKEE